MTFVVKPGVTGKIYVPDKKNAGRRKHPCQDCFACQLCSDDRCQLCLVDKTGRCDCSAKENDT